MLRSRIRVVELAVVFVAVAVDVAVLLMLLLSTWGLMDIQLNCRKLCWRQ